MEWIVRLHAKYCRPRFVPIAWTLLILVSVLQVVLVALATP